MNLSRRLDEARRQREEGLAKPLEPDTLDLRYVDDGQSYDGHELRTGQELTEERWEQLEQRTRTGQGSERHPYWRPDQPQRAETLEDAPPLIDLTRVNRPTPTTPAGRSHISRVPDPPSDDSFELPAWADDREVYRPGLPAYASVDTAARACPNCGGSPRVDVVDIRGGVASLECRDCGFRFQTPAAPGPRPA